MAFSAVQEGKSGKTTKVSKYSKPKVTTNSASSSSSSASPGAVKKPTQPAASKVGLLPPQVGTSGPASKVPITWQLCVCVCMCVCVCVCMLMNVQCIMCD